MIEGAPEPSIPITITHLEMTEQPRRQPPPPPAIPHAVMCAEKITVAYSRFLYNTVGEQWTWSNRRWLTDGELAETVQAEGVETYVLYVRGTPAGYTELDFRELPEVAELSYFGLMPDFIGMKLGPWFLNWTISALWARGPQKVIINTCTADHPAALPMYQRAGFTPVRREEAMLRPMPEQGD